MAVTFDNTLKAATRLREKGGFSETQSKPELVATFADGFVENLATKDDVAHLRGDAKELEVSLCVRAALGPGAHQRSASLALHGSAQPITIGTADRNRHPSRWPPARSVSFFRRPYGAHRRGGGPYQCTDSTLGRWYE